MRMNVLRNQLCNLVDLRNFGFGGGLIIRECWREKYFCACLSFVPDFTTQCISNLQLIYLLFGRVKISFWRRDNARISLQGPNYLIIICFTAMIRISTNFSPLNFMYHYTRFDCFSWTDQCPTESNCLTLLKTLVNRFRKVTAFNTTRLKKLKWPSRLRKYWNLCRQL